MVAVSFILSSVSGEEKDGGRERGREMGMHGWMDAMQMGYY